MCVRKTRNSLPSKHFFFSSNQFIEKFFCKTLIWRNFCEKTLAIKFSNFHNVCLLFWIMFALHCIVWILQKLLSIAIFFSHFREIKAFRTKLHCMVIARIFLKNWFHEILSSDSKCFVLPHCTTSKTKTLLMKLSIIMYYWFC